MDKTYLKYINSSPYVEEGFFDKARASMSGLNQRVKNVLPSEDPYVSILNAKLLSHYNKLISDLKSVLSEFLEGPKSPAERLKKSNITDEQLELINSLSTLYQSLVPSVFPAGTNPKFRGTAIRSGTLNPSNKTIDQSIKHLTMEIWFDRAKNRSGGNVDKIIKKYIDDIKKLYFNFLNNISKYFPGILTSELSNKFKESVNNPKITSSLQTIENTLNTHEEHKKSQSTNQSSSANTSSTSSDNKSDDDTPKEKAKENNNDNANDLATIVSAVLNIISQRVIEDKNSRPYYSKPLANGEYYLPTSVDEPYPLKHSSEWNPPQMPNEPKNFSSLPDDAPEKAKYYNDVEDYKRKLAAYRYEAIRDENGNITGYKYKRVLPTQVQNVPSPTPIKPSTSEPITEIETSGEDEVETNDNVSDDNVELTGEFLYDFASLYRKYKNYTIEVTKNPVKIVLSNNKELITRVFWIWNKRLNTISLQVLKNEEKWEMSEILKFYDDEVNPQSSTYKTNLNVVNFIGYVNKNAAELYKQANNDIKLNVENALKVFKPAAYAVIRRKGLMEFKSYKSLRFHIPIEWETSDNTNPNYGNVKLLRGKFGTFSKGSTIPFKVIYDYYYTAKHESIHEKFQDALDEADYWNSYPGIKDKFIAPAPIISDEGDDINFNDIPAAMDAYQVLITLGYKESISEELIINALKQLGPDKTSQEYVKLALKKSKVPEDDNLKNVSGNVTSEPETKTTEPLTKSDQDTTLKNVNWKMVKNVISAIQNIIKTHKIKYGPQIELLAQQMVDTIGHDKSIEEYEKFLIDNKDQLKPIENFQSKQLKAIDIINTKLKQFGIDTINSIDELNKFNSVKGGYNSSIISKANKLEDDNEKEKILSLQLKELPNEHNKDIWKFLIDKVKNKSKLDEEFINPYQFINFI